MQLHGCGLLSFWICFALFVGGMLVLSWYCKRFMRGVADFMSANRMARKYLMTVAQGMTGATGMVATWQMYYSSGITPQWWELLGVPTGLVVAVTGFIIYRFRETRSLTLGQFFEMRYGRAFRNYAGWISWISGIVNYGVMPAVVADMIQRTLNLPVWLHFSICGHVFDVKFVVLIMAFNLTCAALIACLGGQVSIMLTDFYQEILCKILFTMMICILVRKFFWPDVFAGLAVPLENGTSLVDPFRSSGADFNIWYFLIGVYGNIYNAKSWQGAAGYGTSAKTPHDAQMAGVLSRWRHYGMMASYIIPAVIAYGVLHNATAYPEVVEAVKATGVDLSNGEQSTLVFMAYNIPAWIWGAFAAMLFACTISTDDTSLHSWGGILVQDIILPKLKKPLTPQKHLALLRWAIIGIALWAFLWSCFFPLPKLLYMYFAVTGAIYLGGAGIVIFGGVYLKWGTKAGAFVSMSLGSVFALVGTLLGEPTFWRKLVPYLHWCFPETFLEKYSEAFPLNGQWMYFIAMMIATVSYVIVSLLTCRKPFNLDKMLHRGIYRVEGDGTLGKSTDAKRTLAEKLGYSKEFNRSDSFLFWFTIGYCMFLWVLFLVGCVIHIRYDFPLEFWKYFWGIFLGVQVVIMIVATIWLTIGGLCNACQLPADLREHMALIDDDGTVESDVDMKP